MAYTTGLTSIQVSTAAATSCHPHGCCMWGTRDCKMADPCHTESCSLCRDSNDVTWVSQVGQAERGREIIKEMELNGVRCVLLHAFMECTHTCFCIKTGCRSNP
jgi:hypothetical protein